MSDGGTAEATAARHAALAVRVRGYLDGPFRRLPPGARLGPRLSGAAVLAVGAHALGTAGARSPLQIEIVLEPAEWERLSAEARPSDLGVTDPDGGRAVAVRVRGAEWLAARLAGPGGLWLRQRATVVQDPAGRAAESIRAAVADFRRGVDGLVADGYRAFRDGFETADAALDGLGRRVLLGRAVEGALALPLLCRGEPTPPAEWLAWHLGRVCPEGEEIAALCGRAAAGPTVDLEAYANLRRVIDEMLDAAGHGERVVRTYRGWV